MVVHRMKLDEKVQGSGLKNGRFWLSKSNRDSKKKKNDNHDDGLKEQMEWRIGRKRKNL